MRTWTPATTPPIVLSPPLRDLLVLRRACPPAGVKVWRDTFNYDIARNVPRHVKARFARRYISVMEDYFRNLEASPREAYPLDSDPMLLVRWYDKALL